MTNPDFPAGNEQRSEPFPHSMDINRRSLLAGTAALAFAVTTGTAFAAPVASVTDFHVFSTILTERRGISPVTSQRIFDALREDPAFGPDRLSSLTALARSAGSATALKAAASKAGLDKEFGLVLSAWYTGTVTTSTGPVVVAYKDALMYAPVADGLTVPTYCNYGPIWWTGLPPEITRMPVNNPKVL